jgi:hypothetical protein
MPIQISVETFADGRKYLRSVSSGRVTPHDVKQITVRTGPGGELEGAPLLSILDGKVELDPETRKIFSTMNSDTGKNGNPAKIAIVTSSAPLRVMLSFVLRFSGSAQHIKFFPNEAEAMLWVEVV